MHSDSPRALHGDVPARDGDARATSSGQRHALGRCPVDVRALALHLHVLLGRDLDVRRLRLHLDRARRRNGLDADPVRSGFDCACRDAYRLARVHPPLPADGKVGIRPAAQVHDLTRGQMQVLGRSQPKPSLGAGGDEGIGAMRQLGLGGRGLLVAGVVQRLAVVFAIDHAFEAGDQGGHEGGVAVEGADAGLLGAGVRCEGNALMGTGRVAEGLRQGLSVPRQSDARGVVARGMGGHAVGGGRGVAGEQDALMRADRALGVGAQFDA